MPLLNISLKILKLNNISGSSERIATIVNPIITNDSITKIRIVFENSSDSFLN